jgi:hypothetical protein
MNTIELPIKMTEEEYRAGTDAYEGVCLACGEPRGSCEPDARNYKCEACGQRQVMGLEWAMISGLIEITEEPS